MKTYCLLLVGAIVAAQSSAQDQPRPPPDPPEYFVQRAGVNSVAGCKRNPQYLVKGPIFVPPNQYTLCVFFRKKNRWFLHKGTPGGRCTGQCCEWLPPAANDGTLPNKPDPERRQWFEIAASGNCADTSFAERVPTILIGRTGERRTVCLNLNSDAEDAPVEHTTFQKQTVELTHCGEGNCCIFNPVQ